MTIENKMCAGACLLSTYFINDIFLALINQTCFTTFITLAIAFIIVVIYQHAINMCILLKY